MLFIYPMWDHESQRLGKKKCTPIGYAIHVIADLLGFLGLISLVAAIGWLIYQAIVGSFNLSLLRVLAFPFGLGILGQLLFQFSWWLASRKQFHYDYKKCEASWVNAGTRQTYKWTNDPIETKTS